jgi:hypothetical protein
MVGISKLRLALLMVMNKSDVYASWLPPFTLLQL